MFSATGLSAKEVVGTLSNQGIGEKQATKIVAHAVAHGSYSNKGLTILWDEPNDVFGLLMY